MTTGNHTFSDTSPVSSHNRSVGPFMLPGGPGRKVITTMATPSSVVVLDLWIVRWYLSARKSARLWEQSMTRHLRTMYPPQLSQGGRMKFAATALAPLPIGLSSLAWPSTLRNCRETDTNETVSNGFFRPPAYHREQNEARCSK